MKTSHQLQEIIFIALLLILPDIVQAQSTTEGQQGKAQLLVHTRVDPNYGVVPNNTPITITLFKDGVMVRQNEISIGFPYTWRHLPDGVYEVKFEGEGFETLNKQGIYVTENEIRNVYGMVRPGKGQRIVSYSGVESPCAALATRMERLEKEIALLKAKRKRK